MGNPERRYHHRAGTELGVRIHASGNTLRGRSIDLSRGGVRLRRVDDAAACPAVGSAALVELELGPGGWIAQDGRIVRCDFTDLAIAFDAVAEQVAHAIEEELRAVIASVSRPRLLVVDPSADRRHHIAEKLRAAGCDPYEASTPLEAIDLIERPSNHITGVAVAAQLTQTDADELCEFVAETNPGIKLARIAEALAAEPRHHRITDTLPAVDPTSDDTLERSLRGFVDAVHPPPPRR